QRSTSSAIPACGPKRPSVSRMSLSSRSRFHLHELRRLHRKRRGVRRRDHRLPHARGKRSAPTGVELGQDVVEQEQRARLEERRLGKEERKDGEPLLTLRAELAQIALRAR